MKPKFCSTAIRGILSVFIVVFCASAAFGYISEPEYCISWNVENVEVKVGNGTLPLEGQEITFTSNSDLGDVKILVDPDLQPYVKVSPTLYEDVCAGRTYPVRFEFTLPYNAENGQTVDGMIHLQISDASGGDQYLPPLPMTVNVDFGDIVIAENVKVLSPESVEALVEVSADYNELTFLLFFGSQQLSELKVGDIIVIRESSLIPDGTMAEIEGITIKENLLRLYTSPAALENVIKSGTIKFFKDMGPIDEGGVPGFKEKSKINNITPQGFYVHFNDFVLIDVDGDPQTTYDQLVLSGFFSIDPQLDFEMRMNNGKCEYLRFVPTLVLSQEIRAEAKVEIPLFDKTVSFPASLMLTLLKVPIPSVTIWVGWVPVNISLSISPFFSAEGSVYAGLYSSVSMESSGQLGLEFEEDEYSPVCNVSTRYEYEPIAPMAGAYFKAAIGVKVALKIWWSVGPYAVADKYLELIADVFAEPWWELYGGRELWGGFEVNIPFIGSLYNWEYPVRLGDKTLLAHAPIGQGGLLETLTIPSNGAIVVSQNDYSPTQEYRLEVSGTYIWGGLCTPSGCPPWCEFCDCKRWGDAEWLSDDCWNTHFGEYSGVDISVFVDLQNVNWGPYNDQHTYSIIRNGNGGPFAFHINDGGGWYGDNQGSLTVKIYATN